MQFVLNGPLANQHLAVFNSANKHSKNPVIIKKSFQQGTNFCAQKIPESYKDYFNVFFQNQGPILYNDLSFRE